MNAERRMSEVSIRRVATYRANRALREEAKQEKAAAGDEVDAKLRAVIAADDAAARRLIHRATCST